MRILFVLPLILMLQGCWFVFFPIPTSMFQDGNACGAESVYVGQPFTNYDTNQVGKVVKVIGRDQRCQKTIWPILVEVNYDAGK